MSDEYPFFDLSGWIREIRDVECPVIPANDSDVLAQLAGVKPEKRVRIWVVRE